MSTTTHDGSAVEIRALRTHDDGDYEVVSHADAHFYTVYVEEVKTLGADQRDLTDFSPYWQAREDFGSLAEAVECAAGLGCTAPKIYALPAGPVAERFTLVVHLDVAAGPYSAEGTVAELECSLDHVILEAWGERDDMFNHNAILKVEVATR